MKRVMHPVDITISLVVTIDNLFIQSAKMIGEGILDNTTVIQEWISFIDQFREKVKQDERFKIVHEDYGKYKPHLSVDVPISRYLYIGIRKPGTDEIFDEVAIDFRISDHVSKKAIDESTSDRSKGEAKVRNTYFGSETDFIRGDILVNNKTFKNYTLAMYGALGSLEQAADRAYTALSLHQ